MNSASFSVGSQRREDLSSLAQSTRQLHNSVTFQAALGGLSREINRFLLGCLSLHDFTIGAIYNG
jgi:hypothetical protein